ncbi:bifunctional diguanylate cyclase/phosphodiesterase [Thiomicrorhabdus cannonii]|uniref:bifunctional diguanylate cyclase/phosphodiesterase n=1 Tax=Thiomicrorhabdus cannonii TaxID=2748011 RepID=UPI0015BA9584|nr:EAL domain-containing protein [Thiomicrorhabdus cannonii]
MNTTLPTLPATRPVQNFFLRQNPQFAILALALLLITFSLGYLTHLSLKNQLLEMVNDQARVIVDNISPALQFGDRDSAQTILSSLNSNRSVEAAMLLDTDQKPFAQWFKHRELHPKLTQMQYANVSDTPWLSDNVISLPVWINASVQGHLLVLINYDPLKTRLLTLLSITIIVVLLSLIAAYFMLQKVQRALGRSEAALYQQANFDGITHLPNRYAFFNELGQTLGRLAPTRNPFFLLFFDLDNFKAVNDTHGHITGDKLLYAVGQRMHHNLPKDWRLFHLGSDEFVMITSIALPPAQLESALRMIKQILKSPFVIDANEFFVTMSIGISRYPEHGQTVEALLRSADTALHAGKREHKGQARLFSEELSTLSRNRFKTENALRHAIELDELRLFYQPQISLSTGRIIGVEALLRWQHAEKLIAPDEFIPVAEESGLILELGEWALYEGCKVRKHWLDQGLSDFTIAINLSSRQLTDIDLPFLVQTVLERTCLPARLLELEITESMLMRDLDKAVVALQKLRRLGVKIAIDDFGTGYSSIAYLKQLPIDLLKIDRSFVRDLDHDENDRAIIKAILQLAQTLGLNTLAEGIEEDSQAEYLKQHGCRLGQGYLWAKALPQSEAFVKIRQSQQLKG